MSPSAVEDRCKTLDVEDGSDNDSSDHNNTLKTRSKSYTSSRNTMALNPKILLMKRTVRSNQSNTLGVNHNIRYGNSHLREDSKSGFQMVKKGHSKKDLDESQETERVFPHHKEASERNKRLLNQAKKDIELMTHKANAFKDRLNQAKQMSLSYTLTNPDGSKLITNK